MKDYSLHFRISRKKLCSNRLCKAFLERVSKNVRCCFDTYFWIFKNVRWLANLSLLLQFLSRGGCQG